MSEYASFFLILLLGVISCWLFFHEFRNDSWQPGLISWTKKILQPVGVLLAFCIALRLVKEEPSQLACLALLIVVAGFLFTRNFLGLSYWRRTGDRTGLWSTVGLDLILVIMTGLFYLEYSSR